MFHVQVCGSQLQGLAFVICNAVIGAYAPQSQDPSEARTRQSFWTFLDHSFRSLPARTSKLLCIDGNAHVSHSHPFIGKFGPPNLNNNGRSLISFCHAHHVLLTNTIKPGRCCGYTWRSPDGTVSSRIDCWHCIQIVVNHLPQRWRRLEFAALLP